MRRIVQAAPNEDLSDYVLSEIGRHCRRAGILRDGRLIRQDFVDKLTGTGAKRVTLHGASALPALPGIRDVRQNGAAISFLYSGRADALVAALAGLSFDDISLTDPDIEDVFLHYYEKEEK